MSFENNYLEWMNKLNYKHIDPNKDIQIVKELIKNKEYTIPLKQDTKLGKIPNFSMPPVITCNPTLPCVDDKCYGKKPMILYPNYRTSIMKNLLLYESIPRSETFKIFDDFMKSPNLNYFRWFANGDIPDPEFLNIMIKLAEKHSHIYFLLFTKRFDFINATPYIPSNLKIFFSTWRGLELPENKHNLPWAVYQDGTEKREILTKRSFTCPYIPRSDKKVKCDACLFCWKNPKNKNVIFKAH